MSEKKVRWGIMSTASIGKLSVIPGIQESKRNTVEAAASYAANKEVEIVAVCDIVEERVNETAVTYNAQAGR